MTCSKDAEILVGRPVVVIDVTTGKMVEGVVSGATKTGINRLCHLSINVNSQEEQPPALHTSYTRVNNMVKVYIETILK